LGSYHFSFWLPVAICWLRKKKRRDQPDYRHSLGWKLLSDWIAAGISFGIVKNEMLMAANLGLNIPLKRIEPFATAGYRIIIQNMAAVNNYGWADKGFNHKIHQSNCGIHKNQTCQ